MIKSFRFSIAGLMGVVLVVAIGVAAMRLGSELLAGILFLVTCGVLCLAFIALLCRGPAEQVWWLGFNVFGWVYDTFALRESGEFSAWGSCSASSRDRRESTAARGNCRSSRS